MGKYPRQISIEHLREIVAYDPSTGLLTWQNRPREDFAPNISGYGAWIKHETKFVGQPAFASPQSTGYLSGMIWGRNYLAHRVAWALTHGEWPKMVDHINHDRKDNRMANLRCVSRAENSKNLRGLVPGKVFGVNWFPRYGAWQVMIGSTHLGRFADYDEAVAVRRAAEKRLQYHDNHGKIAPCDSTARSDVPAHHTGHTSPVKPQGEAR